MEEGLKWNTTALGKAREFELDHRFKLMEEPRSLSLESQAIRKEEQSVLEPEFPTARLFGRIILQHIQWHPNHILLRHPSTKGDRNPSLAAWKRQKTFWQLKKAAEICCRANTKKQRNKYLQDWRVSSIFVRLVSHLTFLL